MEHARSRPGEALLALCARPTGNPEQLERLRVAASSARMWSSLSDRAEREGLAPLLRTHLAAAGVQAPAEVARALLGLWLRHRRYAALQGQLLAEVLHALNAAGIETMLLKGSALWRPVYGDPVLRPMRDMDLLVQPKHAARAVAVIEALGYAAEERDPRGHHHLATRYITSDGTRVGIEVHTGLERGKRAGFDELRADAQELDVDGAKALVPAPQQLLRHAYRHGFCLPIHRAESFRLIWAADVIGLVETFADRLDWAALAAEDPRLLGALPWFGCLTPWSEHVQSRVGPVPEPEALLGPLSSVSTAAIASRLPGAVPPAVWLGIRYGVTSPRQRAWARARHALEIMSRM